MKLKLACLSLGLAALGTSGPVAATDWNQGSPGIKVLSGTPAVPVPVPMPIPESHARWYFRADAALGFPKKPSFREDGLSFGAGASAFETRPGWFEHDDKAYAGFGVGVGYSFTPYVRGDITIDTRSTQKFIANQGYYYSSPAGMVNGQYQDTTNLRSVATLFNVYYDFLGTHNRWTPYIGVGMGFAINEIARSSLVAESLTGVVSTAADIGREKTHDVSAAVMGTIGAVYNVSPSVAFDFNYRLLYIGASDASVDVNGMTSKVSIGDSLDHQLRAGVRFNVF